MDPIYIVAALFVLVPLLLFFAVIRIIREIKRKS